MKQFAAAESLVEDPRPFLRVELDSTSETGWNLGEVESAGVFHSVREAFGPASAWAQNQYLAVWIKLSLATAPRTADAFEHRMKQFDLKLLERRKKSKRLDDEN
jgi:hypothetical protein